MTGQEWIAAFAAELGLEPLAEADVEALLDLAGVAAHASERLAAPLTCYLAAMAGVAPADALARARALAGT
ncbi:MAG: molybdopterin-guanine dinucleotide biosynthesis protein [Actinobacteria bacterium]|nr:molybdopterin-guanine dinucleotide biosynthesis protein [Actinomycetota bacterium]